jgi:multicomponent Na+:H+ antiporter subunit D
MIRPETIPLFVALPLAGAFITPLVGKRSGAVCDILSLLVSCGLLLLSILATLGTGSGETGRLLLGVGGWEAPHGILLDLDSLSAFMLVTINLVAMLVIVFSSVHMEHYTSKWKYYTLFLLMMAGMNGVVITGDLFNLFVFLEVASIASYALVAFGTEKHELEAAFKYAVMGSIGSLFVLLAITILYMETSTLNMPHMAGILAGTGGGGTAASAAVVLLLAGFGLKSALVPFHAWLPDAHPSAPAPISAMLSGVLIKALGVYSIARLVFNVFGMTHEIGQALVVLGAVSMGLGALLALKQTDLKRLLAYSSISQVGLIVTGLGIGTPLALLGAVFHVFNHSVFKSLLFLASGAIEHATGTRNIRRMGGLARQMPVTGAASLTATMSLAGVPPFAGFWSKLLIILAAVQAGRWLVAGWAAVVSILTLVYVMKISGVAFSGRQREHMERVTEAPALMRTAMVALALLCCLGGLLLLPGVRDGFLGGASSVLSRGVITLGEVLR